MFNGPIGYFYKQRSDLNIIVLLLEQNFKKVNRVSIIDNLQAIKQNLSFYSNDICVNVADAIDKICLIKSNKRMASALGSVIGKVDDAINGFLLKKYLN